MLLFLDLTTSTIDINIFEPINNINNSRNSPISVLSVTTGFYMHTYSISYWHFRDMLNNGDDMTENRLVFQLQTLLNLSS